MHMANDFEIETFTGKFVDTSQPDSATINLDDVAHALSQTCRYGGHCQSFYSVAAHAVFVSMRLERKGFSKYVQLAGLHHDDAEAYLGDIPRPMKPLLGSSYETLTDRMDAAIVLGLELPLTVDDLHDPRIKEADTWSLFVEARYLLPSQGKGWFGGEQGSFKWGGIEDLPSRIVTPDYWHEDLLPKDACAMFLSRHAQLLEGKD